MSNRAPRSSSELIPSTAAPAPSADRPPMIESLEQRTLLSSSGSTIIEPNVLFSTNASSSSTLAGYRPAQIKAAYGLTSLGTGAGETIAIVDAYNDPNITGDLNTFDSEFGLPSASLKVVNQTGGAALPANNAGWDTEISLDVEWAHAIAPGASILLVETSSDSLSSLLAGVNYARDAAGVSVVSMSWGGSEFSGETSYDSDFTTPAGHQGVTFVASAGDSPGTEWPAISPNVLSVGGTTLELTTTGAYSSETAWSDGGGGYSSQEKEPAYQNDAQSTGERSDPDVSWDANPETGVAVYDSVNYEGYVGWEEVGGTSVGAPSWAGLIAIADQARGTAGTLNGASQTLPILYTLYSGGATSSTYTSSFNDVTSGGGGGGGGFGFGRGRFGSASSGGATVGYDTATGLGSPKGSTIVSALVAGKITTATAATTTTSSGGTTRGGFLFGRGPFVQLLADPQTAALAALSRANDAGSSAAAAAAAAGSKGTSSAQIAPASVSVATPTNIAMIQPATPIEDQSVLGTSASASGIAGAPSATRIAVPMEISSAAAAPLGIELAASGSAHPPGAASQMFAVTWSLAPAALRWYQAPMKQLGARQQSMAAVVVLGAAAVAYRLASVRKGKQRQSTTPIFSDSSIFVG
jgi:subtilase family serine protease